MSQQHVSRQALIEILTVGSIHSFGFKNILIIDASCSDFVNGNGRQERHAKRLLHRLTREGRDVGGQHKRHTRLKRRTRRTRRTRRKLSRY